jgi:hypothetical protein
MTRLPPEEKLAVDPKLADLVMMSKEAPAFRSHSLAVPPSLGVTTRLPSGEKLAACILICPQSLYQSIRESRLSHTTGRIPLGIPS